MGSSRSRGLNGEREWAHLTGEFQRQMKESSGNGASFSPWELCEGNLDGELLYWEPWRICQGRLWKRASFSIGASWRGIHLPGTSVYSRRTLCKRASLAMNRTWRERCFTENSKSYVRRVKEDFGNAVSFSLQRLREEDLEGQLLHWGLRQTCNGRLWKRNIFIGLHKGNIKHLAREGFIQYLHCTRLLSFNP